MAATFSATMAMSGSGGKKDSTIASVMGASGPRLPKPFRRFSQNSSVPSWRRQKFIVHIHPFRLRFPIRRFLYP